MTLFSDESIESDVTSFLRAKGHQVYSVTELSPSISDESVLDFAVRSKAVLLTNDKDFGELVKRHGLFHKGIVLIRLKKLTPSEKAVVVSNVIDEHGVELINAITVITNNSIRIRKQ